MIRNGRRMRDEAIRDTAVGYCMYYKHEGNINAKHVKAHKCLKKKCPYLIKYEHCEFWRSEREVGVYAR